MQSQPSPAFIYINVIFLKTLSCPVVRCLSLWSQLMEIWAPKLMPTSTSMKGVMPAKAERWLKPP